MKTAPIPAGLLVGILVACCGRAAPTPPSSASPALAALEVEILSPLGKPISRGKAVLFSLQTGDKAPSGGEHEAVDFSEGHLLTSLPGGGYWLEILAEGWQAAIEEPLSLAPGQTKKISVTLQPGFVISGVVTDETGRGIGEASVRYHALFGRGTHLRSWRRQAVATAPDGSFRITTLAESTYALTLSAPGYREEDLRGIAAGIEGIKVVLKKGFAIKGKIVGDVPPPGSAIDLELKDIHGHCQRRSDVEVDSEGGFLIVGLEKAKYRLRVRDDGYVSDWIADIPAGPPDGSAPVTVEVRQASSVSGRVLLARTGAPVASADVELFREDSDASAGDYAEENGGFRFSRLVPGAYELKARLPTDPHQTFRSTKKITLVPGQELTGIDLLVEGGREISVRGVVTEENGDPIPDARIEIAAEATSPLRSRATFYCLPESTSTGSFAASLAIEGEAKIIVAAQKEGYAPVASEPLIVGAEQASLEGVTLILPAGASLVIRAADSQGKPIVGAIVDIKAEAYDVRKMALPGSSTRLTDARGLCRFENVPFGDLTVRGTKTGFAPAEGKIALAAGESARDFTLVFEEGKTLVVTVRDEGGQPIANASLETMAMKGDGSGYRSGLPVEAATGTDGTCAITELAKKPLRLSVEAEGYAPARFRRVEADQAAIEVVLIAAGSIAGRALDAQGKPVDNVSAHASRERRGPFDFNLDFPSGRSRGLAAGRFRLDGLKPGKYELIVSATDLAKKKISGLEVLAGGVADAGDVVLAKASVIAGRVGRSPDGLPLGKAAIVRARGVLPAIAYTPRDSSEFELKNLSAGTYTLVFQSSGYREKEIEGVVVAAGERKEIPPVYLDELSDEEKEEIRKEASFIPSLGLSWGKGSGSLFSEGFPVAEVASGSVAEKAGIRPGDTIVKVNGKGFLEDPGAFLKGILGSPGTKVHLAVKRRNGTITPADIVIPEWDYEGLMRKMEEE